MRVGGGERMNPKEEAKKEICRLVEVYLKDVEKWRKINETETRVKFIDCVFRALGWDFTEDVSMEVGIGKESTKKRADYTFSINGITRLIVEAKAIKEDLSKNEFIEQVVGYAFNKSCSWAVLTDFEGFKIFFVDEGSTVFRDIILSDIKRFDENFENLWLISKESFLTNLIEKKAEDEGRKKRRIKIDEQLYQDLNVWREHLYKDIKLHYSSKYADEVIEEIVQKIIDRLIFIRKIEDMQITEPILKGLVRQNSPNIYAELKKIFKKFNEDYNSKLFGETEKEEHEADRIDVGNKAIIQVIEGMYKPSGRTVEYNFAVIDADILGTIYERYLGHILKKRKIVEGQAHRKEQGIYYTPTYIVDYIVRNTVGELLKDKKINPENIHILDPACGSGSFLIKAFDCINDHWKKKEGIVEQTRLDADGITFTRKTQIAKNNIFGVDLDPKAVEIAQLNLLLKLAEKKHRLPTLRNNIKIGNSLIDEGSLSDKVFNWKKQFSEIMNGGGFNVVIGNPPYINMQTIHDLQKYCSTRYPEIYTGQNDILYYFVLRGLNVLKTNGRLGFIISRYFLESSYASKFRKFILGNSAIKTIIDFNNFQVFGKDVNVLTAIIILEKENTEPKRKENIIKVIKLKEWDKSGIELMNHIKQKQKNKSYSDNIVDIFEIKQSSLSDSKWTLSNPIVSSLKQKIENKSILLGELCDIGKGMETGLNEAFVIDKKKALEEKIEQNYLRNYIKTRDLKQFVPLNRGLKIIYLPEKTDEKLIKNVLHHLEPWQNNLKKRFDYKKGHCEWYGWGNLRNRELFEQKSEKIITPLYSTSNKFVYDSGKTNENYHTLTDTYIIVPKKSCKIQLKYLLALLNSKVLEFYFKNTGKLKREGYYEYSGGALSKLPIKYSKKDEIAILQRIEKIMLLKIKFNEIGNKQIDERRELEDEIQTIKKEIDELIYNIYGITEEEKKIIEESLK